MAIAEKSNIDNHIEKASRFLPLSRKDALARGWDSVDFVYILGDAYVDHPSFGAAIISRVLEHAGYRVGIISQPDWKHADSVKEFGRPRLGFLVSSGNMDSMVNHYTVGKRRRSSDAYSPGGKAGLRPDRAAIVYCNLIREAYKDAAIIVGGVEASLRRLAHYDYWSDSLRRSLLLDAQADLLCYGMGERAIVEIADALAAGMDIRDITFVDGTVYHARSMENVYDAIRLPDFAQLQADKKNYAKSFAIQMEQADPVRGTRLVEPYNDHCFVVQNPPAAPLSTHEMDAVYALPYQNDYHPSYKSQGGVPAIEEVKFSLTSCRGCFGNCSFCALAFHQGRIIQSRSKEAIVAEAKAMIARPDFKGYIHDVGGPTANFRKPACKKQLEKGACAKRQCLFPSPCPNLQADQKEYMELLRELRQLPGVKKVFIRSGVRFDYALACGNDGFMQELCCHHVSGQLKLAPEHVSPQVLALMGKPEIGVYEKFVEKYAACNSKLGKAQYVEPYFISSHPGSGLKEAIQLAEYLRDHHIRPEQVQDFYPTPSTVSTCMYYTGLDPRTMKPVFVEHSPRRKAMQRALLQYREPANHALVLAALREAGRTDLIGFGGKCLIPPRPMGHGAAAEKAAGNGRAGKSTGGQTHKRKQASKSTSINKRKPKQGVKKK